MRRIITAALAIAISNSLAQSPPESTEMRVRLLAPLTTKLNRKGDIVSASVSEPSRYKGAILEGDIRDIREGGLSPSKSSSIQLQFHTLHSAGAAIPVAVALVGIANSRNQPGRDEEGSMLESESGNGFAGILHRGSGEAGRISGNPARISAKALNLSLAPGSELELRFRLKPH